MSGISFWFLFYYSIQVTKIRCLLNLVVKKHLPTGLTFTFLIHSVALGKSYGNKHALEREPSESQTFLNGA